MLKQADADLVKDWKESNIDKKLFFEKAMHVTGQHLTNLMKAEVEENKTLRNEITQVGTGNFMDQKQLEIKYANNPARLESILKNTRKFYCEISELSLIHISEPTRPY